MHGCGYESIARFCIFGLDGAQNTPFFDEINNQILQLNYAQLKKLRTRTNSTTLSRF